MEVIAINDGGTRDATSAIDEVTSVLVNDDYTCRKFGGGISCLQEGVKSLKRVASSCAVRKSVSESVGYGIARTLGEL